MSVYSSSMAQWYLRRTGTNQQIGPMEPDGLRQLAESGGLSPDDLVWREGMAEWVPARRLKQLDQWLRSRDAGQPKPGAPLAVAESCEVGPSGFALIGNTFRIGKTGFFGEVIASDKLLFLVLRRRRADDAAAALMVNGGLIGGAIGGWIASGAGNGAAADGPLITAASLPPTVREHPQWAAMKLKPDTNIFLIPRDTVSPAGIVHPKWGNLLWLNVRGEQVQVEYSPFRGKRVEAFLEKAGWPVHWRASLKALQDEIDAITAAQGELAAPIKAARRRTALRWSLVGLGALASLAIVVYLLMILFPRAPRVAIHQACRDGNVELIQQHRRAGTDMDQFDGAGFSPLMSAINSENIEAVRAVLDAGANPNALHPVRAGAAHHAASAGRNDALKLLLERGADPNAPGMHKMNVLHYAAGAGNVEAVRLLLARGMDIEARSGQGRTPLLCSLSRNGSSECVKLLLDAKADPNLADSAGQTPLGAVQQMRNEAGNNPRFDALEQMLLAHGARKR